MVSHTSRPLDAVAFSIATSKANLGLARVYLIDLVSNDVRELEVECYSEADEDQASQKEAREQSSETDCAGFASSLPHSASTRYKPTKPMLAAS